MKNARQYYRGASFASGSYFRLYCDREDDQVFCSESTGKKNISETTYQKEVDAYLETEEGKRRMAQRSSEAEGAFGDIKKNFGYSLLRRRGESGVRVELGLVILGYNLRHYHRQRTKLMK